MLLDGIPYADDVSVTLHLRPRGWFARGLHSPEREQAVIAALRRAAPLHGYSVSSLEITVQAALPDDDARTIAQLRRDELARLQTIADRAYAHPEDPVPRTVDVTPTRAEAAP